MEVVMAINGIDAYTNNLSLTDYLTGTKNKEESTSTSSLLGSSTSVSGGSSISQYMLGNSEEIQAILDELSKITGGSVSFAELREYQAELQRQFNEAVKEDLQTMGVDPNTEFTLASDGEGGIKVLCDSADKSIIEAYFAQNEEMVGAFNKLQTLSNLDKARKEQDLSVAELKTRTQIEAVAKWWSSEGTDYSQYMYYGNDTALQFLGVSGKV